MATISVVKEARYVLTNIEGNNNKFWNIKLLSDGSCETHWGRVGEDGQRKVFPSYSEYQLDAKCREKEGKGYRPQKTLANTAGNSNLQGETLAKVAAEQIVTSSPETQALVQYLARVNVHRILEATTMTYDESQGTFSTPLGVVTQDALTEARALLSTIGQFVAASDWSHACFIPTLNDYLMLIPQNIGRAKPDPKVLFPDTEAVQKQNGILDALEASLALILKADEDSTKEAAPAPKLFEARLELVTDQDEIERIRCKYQSTQKAMHACAHLDVKRVFKIEIAAMSQKFEAHSKKIGNVQELWHGTQASNLLSILRSGFVIAPASASHCCGRAFGNGIYFSDQSTKSLNYAYGYWRGKSDNHCFMFLCDVAMGKVFRPQRANSALDPRKDGYDSTFAEAGKCTVANNEMIVYDTQQICPRFLVEFGS
ncbi:MAG: WGR domain-containing protein [Armatimonadetes bacterium]|nr:WGR domain-containing protein [Armatimonadota bacterium]